MYGYKQYYFPLMVDVKKGVKVKEGGGVHVMWLEVYIDDEFIEVCRALEQSHFEVHTCFCCQPMRTPHINSLLIFLFCKQGGSIFYTTHPIYSKKILGNGELLGKFFLKKKLHVWIFEFIIFKNHLCNSLKRWFAFFFTFNFLFVDN